MHTTFPGHIEIKVVTDRTIARQTARLWVMKIILCTFAITAGLLLVRLMDITEQPILTVAVGVMLGICAPLVHDMLNTRRQNQRIVHALQLSSLKWTDVVISYSLILGKTEDGEVFSGRVTPIEYYDDPKTNLPMARVHIHSLALYDA